MGANLLHQLITLVGLPRELSEQRGYKDEEDKQKRHESVTEKQKKAHKNRETIYKVYYVGAKRRTPFPSGCMPLMKNRTSLRNERTPQKE